MLTTRYSVCNQRRHTMKNWFLLVLLLFFCDCSVPAYSQIGVVKSSRVPTSTSKIDSARIQEYQRILEDLCVKCGIIKGYLPAATQRKMAPAIITVREFWRSHLGNPEVLTLAGSEVRRIFGSRPKKEENVLVCYLFGEARKCLENDVGTVKNRRQEILMMNALQMQTQFAQAASGILKSVHDTERSLISNIR